MHEVHELWGIFIKYTVGRIILHVHFYLSVGTGSLLTAVEIGAQKKAVVCGKPEKPIFDVLVQEQNVDPAKTIMIGDRYFIQYMYTYYTYLTIKVQDGT